MTRDTLLDLARRVEQATGEDRMLDAEIALFVEPELKGKQHKAGWPGFLEWQAGAMWGAENYTASLDAAAALVPEGWTGTVHLDGKAMLYRDDREPYVAGLAATPALALTAAALRARAEETENGRT